MVLDLIVPAHDPWNIEIGKEQKGFKIMREVICSMERAYDSRNWGKNFTYVESIMETVNKCSRTIFLKLNGQRMNVVLSFDSLSNYNMFLRTKFIIWWRIKIKRENISGLKFFFPWQRCFCNWAYRMHIMACHVPNLYRNWLAKNGFIKFCFFLVILWETASFDFKFKEQF